MLLSTGEFIWDELKKKINYDSYAPITNVNKTLGKFQRLYGAKTILPCLRYAVQQKYNWRLQSLWKKWVVAVRGASIGGWFSKRPYSGWPQITCAFLCSFICGNINFNNYDVTCFCRCRCGFLQPLYLQAICRNELADFYTLIKEYLPWCL